MNEEQYTIAEDYELPSKGLIYSSPINPKVTLRSMTTREEMKRLSPTNTPYKNLSDIIESCLTTKLPISVYDLCLGDYEYLLHKLRVVSYGPDYKMNVVCPRCGETVTANINLDDLKTIDYDLKDFNKSLFLELSKSKKQVVLKYQTPRILDAISIRTEELKKQSKDTTIDFNLLATLEYAIDTVNGEKLTYINLEQFVNNLPVSDMNKILNTIQEINRKVGLKTDNIPVKCDNCGYEIMTFFRFGPEFFRPTDN